MRKECCNEDTDSILQLLVHSSFKYSAKGAIILSNDTTISWNVGLISGDLFQHDNIKEYLLQK